MQNEQQEKAAHEDRSLDAPAKVTPRLSSATLFGESRVLVIEHEGVSYVLRITRNGKLILTK